MQYLRSTGVTGRELWPPERIDEVDDSERKDNARTKNHENFCGQDALPILWYGFVVREKWPTLRLGRVSQNKRLELLLADQRNHAALVFAAIWYFPSHVFSTSTGEVIRPL